jgi:RES domain-containing protein
VIYAASSLALAALEILASRTEEFPDDYVATPVELPDDVPILALSESDLPANWWSNPHPVETQELGTQWASYLSSAVLSVPSAVIRLERNYILNPAHSDFSRIRFADSRNFLWDDRLRGSKRR